MTEPFGPFLSRVFPRSIVLAFSLSLPAARAQDASPLPWEQRLQLHQPPPPPPPPAQFLQICALCHGNDGRGSDRAPSLVNAPDLRAVSASAIADIIQKGKSRMPALPLPPADTQVLAAYVLALNMTGMAPMAGDPKAGEAIFFGRGQCSTCHIAEGRGSSLGPDLSDVAQTLGPGELIQSLADPRARIATGYAIVSVEMNDRTSLRGFARAQGEHDLVLQTSDGKLHLLLDTEYQVDHAGPAGRHARLRGNGRRAARPARLSQPAQRSRDRAADRAAKAPVSPAEVDAITHPEAGGLADLQWHGGRKPP
jgi:putative heme-binding domain-containing protein